MALKYKIHPAIGIARLGNSEEYYLTPEVPGSLPLDPDTDQPIYSGPGVPPNSVFRDDSGMLKKQAARFKVFVYDDTNPDDPGSLVEVGSTQVNGQTVVGIEWTVYLASKKASWFQFKQLTGSGMQGDAGYLPNGSLNPLRFNTELGTTADPATLDDPARMQLVIDPGERTVSGPNASPQSFDVASMGLSLFDIGTLGQIKTDADNNLIVLGGEGSSGTTRSTIEITHYANNEGWFDDVSDGTVTGTLLLEDGNRYTIDMPSWVLCSPPAYAPEINNMIPLYDTLYDVYVRELGLNPALFADGTFQTSYLPNKEAEIDRILVLPGPYQYVSPISTFGNNAHDSLTTATSKNFNNFAFKRVRQPDQTEVGDGLMPTLAGDNPITDLTTSPNLAVTQTQYFFMSQYANGDFTTTPTAPIGDGGTLDRASLESCVGGAFCPGIEMTWICRNPSLYEPLPTNHSISDAFRFRHKPLSSGLTLTNGADNDYSGGLEPGDVTKYMAQPWQADFNECAVEVNGHGWWWPAQRPLTVYPAADPNNQVQWTRMSDEPGAGEIDNLQMVTSWKDLGVILNVGSEAEPSFLEIERNAAVVENYTPTEGAEPLVATFTPLKHSKAKNV